MIPKVIAAIVGPKRLPPHRPPLVIRRPGQRKQEGKEDRGAGHDNGGGDNDRPLGVARIGQPPAGVCTIRPQTVATVITKPI